MKRITAFMLLLFFAIAPTMNVFAESETKTEAEHYQITPVEFEVDCKSALLMEATTGEIIYSHNENEALIPASVTKIMTLLLVTEAIEDGRISLDDSVTVSMNAASKGGSQVFLEEGEKMTVRDLLECTVIASANDAAVALSEHIFGSEGAFVENMNKRAAELGMNNSHFENTTGLDDTTKNHVTSALDIAIMSRELISHELILEYSSLWQDTIRNGEFTLTNTNRLVRYYDGCNGLKTGSTDKAGYCISATAKRDDMQLIAVIMGAETRDKRNEIARELLDFGFANYALYCAEEEAIEKADVWGATKGSEMLYSKGFTKLIDKKDRAKVEKYYNLPDYIEAPILKESELGTVRYAVGEKILHVAPVYVKCDIEKIGAPEIFISIIRAALCGKSAAKEE